MSLGTHRPFRFLIRGGSGQFTRLYNNVLTASGITAIRIPPRSPQANAFAERWVRTLRHELLDRTIIWNERKLRRLLEEYIEHYNTHRPHRGIGQRAPSDAENVTPIRPGHDRRNHDDNLPKSVGRLFGPFTLQNMKKPPNRRFEGFRCLETSHGVGGASRTLTPHTETDWIALSA